MQSTDGQITEPYSISALRQQEEPITDEQAMQWGLKLSKMEGIIPAIETAHALPFWTK
jgi:tryptophan synthase beta chain